jgi:photosystem II stability/assembly factor-like uncharacterized protein
MRLRLAFFAALLFAALASAGAPPRWIRIGPDGGRVLSLAAAPSRPAVLYAGTDFGGVFRSSDNGAHWAFAGTGLGWSNGVYGLAVDPVRPDTVWAATVYGIFKSDTGGTAWFHLGPQTYAQAVAVHPRRPSIVFAVLQTTLAVTRNGGATWAPLGGSAPTQAVRLLADTHSSGTLYALGGGLFRTVDGGATWTRLKSLGVAVSALAIDPRDSRTLFAADRGGILRSTDGGSRWTRVLAGSTVSDLAVAPPPKSAVYAATDRGLLRSLDNGRTWQAAGPGIAPLRLVAGPASVVAGSLDGVFASFDRGASWPAGQGLQASSPASLAVTRESPPRIFVQSYTPGAAGVVLATTNGGASWDNLGPDYVPAPHFGTSSALGVAPGDPGTLYLGTPDGFFRSVDGGQLWTRLPWDSCVAPHRIRVDPGAPATLYLSGTGTGPCAGHCFSLKSTDAGSTWSCVQKTVLQIDPFATSHLIGIGPGGLQQSTDGGASWSPVTPRIDFADIAFSPAQEGLLYAALARSVGRSTDGGATWEAHASGLDGQFVFKVAADPETPATVYAATGHRVFRSLDGDLTWTAVGNPFNEVTISDLAIDPSDPAVLYVATGGGGVMRIQQE